MPGMREEPAARDDDDQPVSALEEIAERGDEAQHRRTYHEHYVDVYNSWRWPLGAAPIVLAAGAGFAATLNASAVITATVAFGAAVVGGVAKLVEPERRSERHARLAAEYADLVRDARAAELRARELPEPRRQDELTALNDRIHDLDVQAGKTWSGS